MILWGLLGRMTSIGFIAGRLYPLLVGIVFGGRALSRLVYPPLMPPPQCTMHVHAGSGWAGSVSMNSHSTPLLQTLLYG